MKRLPAFFLAILSSHAFGQTVAYTSPSGYVKTDLVVGFNPIGINLHGEVLLSGVIDSESANVITDADVDFAATLTDANATYLLEITNGAQNGSVNVITSSTSTTVTIEGGGIAAGTANYTIRKAKTLNEVFGTGADAQLTGSFNSTNSDIIWVPDGSGDYDRYYYNSNNNEFRSTASQFSSPPKPIAFFYPDGAFVEVKANTTTVTLFGEVKKTGTIISAASGFSIFTVPSPAGQTLDELGLKDDLTASFNSTAADILWVPDGAGSYNRYFVHTTGGGTWRSTSSQFSGNEGTTVVSGAIAIQRKTASTSALAEVPAFFSTL
ncbi:MAG: hypothetical protein ACSHYF_09545 [Verrucomicrobiaceae bacterium]